MSTPHKHAALIHAWADGAEIQSRAIAAGNNDNAWGASGHPIWDQRFEYRIKPHRWQECIDAQKAGKMIQARVIGSKVWTVQSSWDFEIPNAEFRIKPEMIRFRNYKYLGAIRMSTGLVNSAGAEQRVAEMAWFRGWLGDWQEVEA